MHISFTSSRLARWLMVLLVALFGLMPAAVMADDGIKPLLTPFYDPNSADCSNGFLGTGPLYGPAFPTAIQAPALKSGLSDYIKQHHPDSPMLPLVDFLISQGKSADFNPAMVVAMAQKETQLGTVGNGTPSGGYNITNIRQDSHSFRVYGSYQQGIQATYDNLNTDLYGGLGSVAQIINIWAPPSENDTSSYVKFMAGEMAVILGGGAGIANASIDACATGQLGGGNGQVSSGDTASLASKILASSRYRCDNPGDCSDLKAMAAGQSLKGVGSCLGDKINIKVLQLLVYLLDNGFQVGTYALCSDHSSFDGGSGRGHVNGYALDISTVNNASIGVNSPSSASEGLKMDRFLNNLPSALTPDQVISYGYGGQYDPSMAALQMISGQKCSSIEYCVGAYTQATENQHKDHIHVGYR